jgi:hypothetical protein
MARDPCFPGRTDLGRLGPQPHLVAGWLDRPDSPAFGERAIECVSACIRVILVTTLGAECRREDRHPWTVAPVVAAIQRNGVNRAWLNEEFEDRRQGAQHAPPRA